MCSETDPILNSIFLNDIFDRIESKRRIKTHRKAHLIDEGRTKNQKRPMILDV